MAPDEFDDPDAPPAAEDKPSALPRAMAAMDFDPREDDDEPRRRSHHPRRTRRDAARARGRSLPAATPIGSRGRPVERPDASVPDDTTDTPDAGAPHTTVAGDPAGAAGADATAPRPDASDPVPEDSTGDPTTPVDEDEPPAAGLVFEAPATAFPASEDPPRGDAHPIRGESDASGPPATTAALEWVDPAVVATGGTAGRFDTAPYVPAIGGALVTSRRRGRGAIAAPIITALLLAVAYVAAALLWPLDAVAPATRETPIEPATAPDSALPWPEVGSAAVGIGGIDDIPSSGTEPGAMASITKLVTSLMILEELPLELGEQGPEFAFTWADSQEYWVYRANGESALDVPVDGTLTEYQMLEGILVASANNYADRLTTEIWGSDQAFAAAAAEWLEAHDLSDITVVEPTGIDPANTATPAALVRLGEIALENPVIAQIVAEPSVDAPGEDEPRENSNGLLGEEGIVGIKTGTLLNWWNLLAAKDVTVGDTTVRLYAAVVGQPDDDGRLAVARDLFAELEQSLAPFPSVTAGTVVATVTTEWGAESEVVIAEDASVVLWDGGSAGIETDLDLGDARDAGDSVGSVAVAGPLDDTEAGLELAGDIEAPSPWWRLTHPLDLLGLY